MAPAWDTRTTSPGWTRVSCWSVALPDASTRTIFGCSGSSRWVTVMVDPSCGVAPPAAARARFNDCVPNNGYVPGFLTSPSTVIPSVVYSLTVTDTWGPN